MNRIAIGLAALAALAVAPAGAQDLRVGLGAMTRSMDPHFANTGPDVAQSVHVFDKLIGQDENQKLVPGLAVAWRVAGEKRRGTSICARACASTTASRWMRKPCAIR